MHKGLKLAHLGGLVIFLGSILTFVVISALIEDSSLENVVFGRQIISTGTKTLTLPGMWVIAVTGVWMGYKRYGPKRRYFQIKALIIILIAIHCARSNLGNRISDTIIRTRPAPTGIQWCIFTRVSFWSCECFTCSYSSCYWGMEDRRKNINRSKLLFFDVSLHHRTDEAS
jgi:UDP-N-acetylmuramyl pentapeptide phosphotransferase/UDP-N-acetylglucosamine-1-phosphate transferase